MEKKFVILTDAGGDFTPDQRERYGIEMPPKSTVIWPDGVEREADIDWELTTPDEYYKLMSKKNGIFATAFPTPKTIVTRMCEYCMNGQDIICCTISSAMSGGYSAFTLAAKEVMERYPERKIHVIDSLRYGGAISLICLEASRCREKGMSFDETVEYMEEMKLHIHQCGVLDDLYFLARKGRIPKAAAVMGTMVGVKPMADLCNETGMSQVIVKAKGYKNFYKIFPQYVKETIGNPDNKIFLVSQSLREDKAMKLIELIKTEFPTAIIEYVVMGQSTGANVGPGLCAAFYIGDERVSPNCEKEKEIYARIMGK